MIYALAAAWLLGFVAAGLLAGYHVWWAALPLAILLIAVTPVWVGNILADRIEALPRGRR